MSLDSVSHGTVVMKKINTFFFAAALFGFSLNASATPTLQVHGVGSVTGSITSDEDTWFASGAIGELELIATFSDSNIQIQNVFLVLTTSATAGNPFAGTTKYDDANAFEASIGAKFNNHSPYGLDGSLIDTFTYSLSDFTYNAGSPTKDCNADSTTVALGSTECSASSGTGDIKIFSYDYSSLALDWVHFDLVAYIVDPTGKGKWASTWGINPGSHDTTWQSVPEATSLLFLMLGLLGLVVVRRKA